MGISQAFGSKTPLKPHLVEGPGGLAAEIDKLRKDTDEAAVPDPNAMPSVPPSRDAMFCSSAVRVGFETREYS